MHDDWFVCVLVVQEKESNLTFPLDIVLLMLYDFDNKLFPYLFWS